MSTYLLSSSKRSCKKTNNGNLLAAIFGPLLEFRAHLQYLDKLLNKKPKWSVYIPKRAWRRHSAYLTCLHELHLSE